MHLRDFSDSFFWGFCELRRRGRHRVRGEVGKKLDDVNRCLREAFGLEDDDDDDHVDDDDDDEGQEGR